MSRQSCEATQQGDQMQCGRCGLAWDVSDTDPPRCGPRIDKRAIPARTVTRAVGRVMSSSSPMIPRGAIVSIGVPDTVLDAMAREFNRYIGIHGPRSNRTEAMRAALAVYLEGEK